MIALNYLVRKGWKKVNIDEKDIKKYRENLEETIKKIRVLDKEKLVHLPRLAKETYLD